MKIAIAQVAHETSTFSTVETTVDTFKQDEWTHGQEIIEKHGNVRNYLGGMIQKGQQLNVDLVPIFSANCNPSGMITKDTYDRLIDELISGLQSAGELDAICLVLHGAGVAEEHADFEGALLRTVRGAVGYKIPISVALDLHGNITERMVEEADALLGVKHYPHTDTFEAGAKAMSVAVQMLKGDLQPSMTIKQLPLLMFPSTTFQSPAKDIKQLCEEQEKKAGVVDCTFFHGFARADTKHTGSSVLTITNNDPKLAKDIGGKVAKKVWDVREQFVNDYLNPEGAIEQALATEGRPIVVNETSDNPGSGAPGDGTNLLKAMVKKNIEKSAFGFIYDPEVASIAHEAGVGATINVKLGGKTDDRHGEPLPIKAYVKSLTDGQFIQSSPMFQGANINLGKSVRLQVGHVQIIVCSAKKQTLDKELFLLHGIDITEYKVIALKSCQHFRAGFSPYAKEIITADSPGISTSNPSYYDYKEIPRPIFPLDWDMVWEK